MLFNMFVGTIENLNKPKVFYMVYVEGSNTPQKKHEVYEDAFQEMQRLSKKENKICYVLKSIVQVEQIPKITKLIEECENFFIPSKSFKRNAMKNKLKIGDKVGFHSGNYEGLTGEIIDFECNGLFCGINEVKYTVKLSNDKIGYIEKSEHWHFI